MHFLTKAKAIIFLLVFLPLLSGCTALNVRVSGNGEEIKYKMYGDADADGSITAVDAGLILCSAVSADIDKDSSRFLAYDVDYDGFITSVDARTVLRANEELCSLGEGAPHEHIWGEWTTEKASTCTEAGFVKRYCTKNDTHFQIIYTGKTGHNMTLNNDDLIIDRSLYKAPFYACSSCGGFFKDVSGDTVLVPEIVSVQVSGEQKVACDKLSDDYSALCVQAAVIKDGRVDSVYSYGTAERSTGRQVDENTKYRVASITKFVSSMVFFCLQQEGLVDENEDISAYFGYTCRNPYFPDVVITPLMIMSHTASMVDTGPYKLSDDTLASPSFYLQYEPGTKYIYSNSGFAVIQCICESVTGMEFDAIAKKYIFEPLGIDAAYIASGLQDTSRLGELTSMTIETMLSRKNQPLGRGLNFAQGNLFSSAKDFAKILCLMLNDGVTEDGVRILTSENVKKMETVVISGDYYDVCLGMRLQTNVFEGKTVFTHTGSSYGMYSTYLICPEENSGVVVFTSGCSPEKDETTQLYEACFDYIKLLYPENR